MDGQTDRQHHASEENFPFVDHNAKAFLLGLRAAITFIWNNNTG